MLRDGAFTVLLLLISAVSAETVPPPTNVTLSCQNLKTTVSWEYNKHQPQTSFCVKIKSSEECYGNTTDHQYDLSRFIWESTDRYKDIHSVTVIGIQGGKMSEPVTSNTLTFNDIKLAHKKCVLNFPPVNLTVEDSRSTVSFQNPLLFYKELKQATKPDTYFDFSVSSDNGSLGEAQCQSTEPICRFDFSFPEGVEECVTLVGWLMTGQRTDWVAFNKTGRICHTDSTDVHWVILAVVLGGLVLVITAVTISVCCVKAWTTKPLPTPIVRDWDTLPPNVTQPEEEERTVLVTVEPRPVVPDSSKDDYSLRKSLEGSGNSSIKPNLNRLHYRTGRLSEGSSQELDAGRDVTDEESADGSEKTECVSIDDEEEVERERKDEGHYDRRPQILQDMGGGDMVETYSQR